MNVFEPSIGGKDSRRMPSPSEGFGIEARGFVEPCGTPNFDRVKTPGCSKKPCVEHPIGPGAFADWRIFSSLDSTGSVCVVEGSAHMNQQVELLCLMVSLFLALIEFIPEVVLQQYLEH